MVQNGHLLRQGKGVYVGNETKLRRFLEACCGSPVVVLSGAYCQKSSELE